MTYRSFIGDNVTGYNNEEFGYPQTYMMLDIAALQYMYGADFTSNGGDTVYSWSPTTGDSFVNGVLAIDPGANRIFSTIWDGDGIDTYDLSNYTTNLRLDLRPGESSTFSDLQRANLGSGHLARGNVFNALQFEGDARSLIENAFGGSGYDILTGNDTGNTLAGSGGNDLLFGHGANDVLVGGEGGDMLNGGAGRDYAYYINSSSGVAVNLLTGGAAGGEATGDTLSEIESLVGSGFADGLTGNNLANELVGGDGDDALEGLLGGDILVGGNGNDTASYLSSASAVSVNLTNLGGYAGDAAGDQIVGIENVTGSGRGDLIRGDGLANLLFGASGDDILFGEDGGDILVGGAGGDLLVGGAGEDFLFLRNEAGGDLALDFDLNGNDAIIFSGFGPEFGFANLVIAATGPNDTIIYSSKWAGSLTLQGTSASLVGSDDFLFV